MGETLLQNTDDPTSKLRFELLNNLSVALVLPHVSVTN